MPSIPSRLMLFLSSYSPLLAILAVRNWDSRAIALALLLVGAASVLWLVAFIHHARTIAPTSIEIDRATSKDGELVSYIVTYLLPFLAIDFAQPADVLSLSILLVVIALLYVHSNLIYVNPLLAALGLHLIEIEETNGKVSILLSPRRYVRSGTRVRVIQAGDLLNLEARDDGE